MTRRLILLLALLAAPLVHAAGTDWNSLPILHKMAGSNLANMPLWSPPR